MKWNKTRDSQSNCHKMFNKRAGHVTPDPQRPIAPTPQLPITKTLSKWTCAAPAPHPLRLLYLSFFFFYFPFFFNFGLMRGDARLAVPVGLLVALMSCSRPGDEWRKRWQEWESETVGDSRQTKGNYVKSCGMPHATIVALCCTIEWGLKTISVPQEALSVCIQMNASYENEYKSVWMLNEYHEAKFSLSHSLSLSLSSYFPLTLCVWLNCKWILWMQMQQDA